MKKLVLSLLLVIFFQEPSFSKNIDFTCNITSSDLKNSNLVEKQRFIGKKIELNLNTNELKVKNSNNNPDTDILSGLQFSSVQAVKRTDNIAIVHVFPPDHKVSKLIEKAKGDVELEKDKPKPKKKSNEEKLLEIKKRLFLYPTGNSKKYKMKIEFKKPDGTYFKKGQEITFEDIKSLPAEYFFDLRLGAILYDAKQEYLVHTGQIKSSTKEAEKEKKLKEKKLKEAKKKEIKENFGQFYSYSSNQKVRSSSSEKIEYIYYNTLYFGGKNGKGLIVRIHDPSKIIGNPINTLGVFTKPIATFKDIYTGKKIESYYWKFVLRIKCI